MVILFFQFGCILLFVIGLILAFIELRTRFDRSFLYFGINTVLLCLFSAVDVWMWGHKAAISPHEYLYWIRIQHIVFSPVPLFLAWYLMILTKSENEKLIRILIFVSLLFAVLTFSDTMLTVKDGQVVPNYLYEFLYAPFLLVFIVGIVAFIFVKLKRSPAPERKILRFHLLGIFVLALCGVCDLCIMLGYLDPILPSFTILGVLTFGAMTTIVFAERLLILIREREVTFEKLQTAYKDLEQASSLKTLGQSTAIINHEIKNYLFVISGYATLLQTTEKLSPKGGEIVLSLQESIKELHRFSMDILELSKSRIIKEKTRMNISQVILDCIKNHFPKNAGNFALVGTDKEHFIHGDWVKMEHVFTNIFKNSFEARAATIGVRIVPSPNVLLITIEDDGIGCSEDQVEGLFKAFFTTKTGTYGTGLGMSISRTIVESHGGRISAYSKNLLKTKEHGLIMNLTFPVFDEARRSLSEEKSNIVLVKDGFDDLAPVLRVFQNVCVTPHVVQSVAELAKKKALLENMAILAHTGTADELSRRFKRDKGISLIACHKNVTWIIDLGSKGAPALFSEEYVLSHLAG